eukprot:1455721-Rhodomonas_salina.1
MRTATCMGTAGIYGGINGVIFVRFAALLTRAVLEDGGFNCVSEDAYREHEVLSLSLSLSSLPPSALFNGRIRRSRSSSPLRCTELTWRIRFRRTRIGSS